MLNHSQLYNFKEKARYKIVEDYYLKLVSDFKIHESTQLQLMQTPQGFMCLLWMDHIFSFVAAGVAATYHNGSRA
jgi:hypothetical protein